MIKARLAVVILNWNGANFLQKFLPGIIQHSSMEGVNVIVADNGSSDNSLEVLKLGFPTVKVIALDANYGFPGGYNRAFEQIDCEYFLLLNSDVEVEEGWLMPLIEFMDSHKDCAACVPKLKDYNNRNKFEYAGAAGGFIDKYGYPFCRGRIFDTIEDDLGQYNDACPIFWGSGAALLVRSSAYKIAGGMDERFFVHMEEIDLCWRFWNLGFSVYYIPQSSVYHVGGGTLPQGNPRKTYFNFRNSLFLLFKNLPIYQLVPRLFLRMILDGIAALKALSAGSFAEFKAIFKAHMAFYQQLPYYIKWRKNNKVGQKLPSTILYSKSIVFQYFAKKKTTFTDLRF
jgi:GT2 family glycosyltransferase